MAGILRFDPEAVVRLIEHAQASTEWTQGWGDADTGEHPRPQIVFVHDQGLYVMSNGNAPDLPEGQRVVYAEGFDPSKTEFDEWWEGARDVVGGDDFAEYLDADTLLPPEEGATAFIINVTDEAFEVGWEVMV